MSITLIMTDSKTIKDYSENKCTHDENDCYDINYLLDRAYSSFSLEKDRIKYVLPKLERKDRKIYVTNFEDICNSMKRDADSVRLYISKELNMDTSIKKNGYLKIDGTSKNITEDTIKKFISEYITFYVMCSACKSCKTTTLKEDRITFLVCETCKCKKAVTK